MTRRAACLIISSRPQDIAIIVVKGKEFKIYKTILTQDPRYFERALNGSFVEGEPQIIEMGDDVTFRDFGSYVDCLYRSLFNKDSQFQAISTPDFGIFLRKCLGLWQLLDRFLNQRMQSIAQEALEFCAAAFSMTTWEILYENPGTSDQQLEAPVFKVPSMVQLCGNLNVPFQELFVVCASNMPIQLFTELHDKLDIDFRTPVMKKILKRAEKPGLKRPAPADAEGDKPLEKKQKQGPTTR